MPVVFRDRGRRLHFYSDEGQPREPPHIHVSEAGKEAKFWIGPPVRLARNTGYNERDLRELERLITARTREIERAWHEHFS